MFNNIRCITFDLDDTLWPVKPVILKAEQALYQWLCEHYPRVTDTYTVQQLTQQRVTLTMRYPDISHDVSLLRWQFLAELAEQFDYPDSLADQVPRGARAARSPIPTLIPLRSRRAARGSRFMRACSF